MHVGQLGGVARLEQQPGAGAVDQLGQAPGAGDDERRAAGEGLEGDDAERLVQRRDDDDTGAVDEVAEPVVGQEAGQVDEVADALEVDLRLQLRQVAAAAADDALDAGDTRPQQAHRRGEDLEALLVLHPAPREHERGAAARHLARRPPRRVDAVGDEVGALDRQLEAVDDLADHEAGAGQDGGRRRGRATTRRRGPCSASPAAPARRAGRARSSGTWRRAGRRAAWPACRRPRRPASRGRGRCRAATGRGATASWTRWWLAEATRATSVVVGQPRQVGAAPAAPAPRRRCRRPARPGG